MSGLWVFVCGPSGAGKDSVMAWAADHLKEQPGIVFSRRLITRPLQPGSDHDPVTPQQFSDLHAAGALAWHWAAHGFSYGVRAHYSDAVAAGHVVVVNGSREHANTLIHGAQRALVVQIEADAAQIEQRLVQRGRDTPKDIERRKERNAQLQKHGAALTIVNDSTLAQAGEQLVAFLQTHQRASQCAAISVGVEG